MHIYESWTCNSIKVCQSVHICLEVQTDGFLRTIMENMHDKEYGGLIDLYLGRPKICGSLDEPTTTLDD